MIEEWDPQYKDLLRTDLTAFTERCFRDLVSGSDYHHNWHLDLIAEYLEKVRHGGIRRLIINQPPRSLKSISISVAYVAWMLGHYPEMQIICLSYGQDLSDKHAQDCRRIMESDWYRRLFPGTRLFKRAINDLVTTKNGGRMSTSFGGTLTGRGADLIIVDDPIKPEDALSAITRKNANEYYDSTLISRLNSKATGRIIIVMQRLHIDDLIGHVCSKETYEVLSLSAIAAQDEHYLITTPYRQYSKIRHEGEALHPERESVEVLHELRYTMGEYYFSAQYQQSPVAHGGNLIKEDWFSPYDDMPQFDYKLQSWDTASKAAEHNDYSVCITFGVVDQSVYILDVFRERLTYPDLKDKAKQLYDFHLPHVVLIEDQGSGMQLLQDMLHEGYYQAEAYKPQKEKLIRLDNQSGRIRSGFVFIPQRQTHWKADFVSEIISFPVAKHDDQVDAFSQALDWISCKERAHKVEIW